MTDGVVPLDRLNDSLTAALREIAAAAALDDVEKLRIRFLGKQGEISLLLRGLGQMPEDQRPAFGQAVNTAKQKVQQALNDRKDELSKSGGAARPKSHVDVTLPGIWRESGRAHPLMRTMEELKTILQGMGFRYDDYPEVESEYYNFDALNTPAWHPSRDLHDSFYTEQGHVMRTHTSAFQVRAMRMLGTPPIRAMTSGRCYRRDEIRISDLPPARRDRDRPHPQLRRSQHPVPDAHDVLGPGIRCGFARAIFRSRRPRGWMSFTATMDGAFDSGLIRPEVLQLGDRSPGVAGFAFVGIDRI